MLKSCHFPRNPDKTGVSSCAENLNKASQFLTLSSGACWPKLTEAPRRYDYALRHLPTMQGLPLESEYKRFYERADTSTRGEAVAETFCVDGQRYDRQIPAVVLRSDLCFYVQVLYRHCPMHQLTLKRRGIGGVAMCLGWKFLRGFV